MLTKRTTGILVFVLALTATRAVQAQSVQAPPPPAAQLQALSQLQIRETSGTLFENVARVLAEHYVDEEFRKKQLPALVQRYRAQAAAALSLRDQRQVVHELLSHIPASHLGLLSRQAHRSMMADLAQSPYPSFGFQAIGSGASGTAHGRSACDHRWHADRGIQPA